MSLPVRAGASQHGEPSASTGLGAAHEDPAWERHPADTARLVLSAALTAALVLVVRLFSGTFERVSHDLVRLLGNLPDGLAFGLVGLVQVLVTVGIVVAVVWLLRSRRWRLIGLVSAAAGAGAVAMWMLGRYLRGDVPDYLERSRVVQSWLTNSAYPPTAMLAAGAAVLTAVAPFVPRSWHRSAWAVLGVVASLRVLTATELPVNLVLILAVGTCMGSLALVVVGAPHRHIDLATIGQTLGSAGLSVTAVELVDADRVAPTFRVRTDDSAVAHVELLGRDQRDQALVLRAWRALRVKGFHDRVPSLSPRGVAEREQLALALAAAAGVAAERPLAIALTDDEAALVVTSWVDGPPLTQLAPDAVDDSVLVALWQQVAWLHDRRIAHGNLNAPNVLIERGEPVLIGFRAAVIAADDPMLAADVAELLCSLATSFGVDRAVGSARRGLPSVALLAALPLLQPLVISHATSAAMRASNVSLAELRTAAQVAVGAPEVELAPLSRVTLKGVVSLVGSLVLASYVFSLAGDWRSITDAFGAMNWAAVPVLVALVLIGNAGGSLAMMGSVNIDLPFLRTNQVMFAQSFLNRFTPANAGGMALRARYLQRQGVDLTVGTGAVALTSAAGGVVQVVFIVGFLAWGGAADELSRIALPSVAKLLGAVVAIGAVVGFVVLSSWGRRTVLPRARTTLGPSLENFARLARQPSKLALLFGGNALSKLGAIAAFAVCASAMGIDMGFARIGALYIIAGTLGAAVPTPGGVGGLEAALTAALISAGVEPAVAGASVLVFRLFTFWFPTLPGWACLQRAQSTGVV